ncbi:MAG: DUF2490 domain-containing protein [Myxococcota bacterium]
MKCRHPLLIVCLATFVTTDARAERDVQGWLSAELAAQRDRLQLSVAPQLRIRDASPAVSEFLTDVGVRVEAARWLRFGGAYRIAAQQQRGGWDIAHRVNGDVHFRLRAGPVRIRSRTRYQMRFAPDRRQRVRHVVRQQFRVRVRAERFRPFVATETFVRIRDRFGTEFWRQRFTAGVGYRRKDHGITLAYRLEVPLTQNNELTSHIFLLGYERELD